MGINNQEELEAMYGSVEEGLAHTEPALESRYRETCILDCDSPSYPPETDEYQQCGCRSCLAELGRLVHAEHRREP
jgi:hypothetical protein